MRPTTSSRSRCQCQQQAGQPDGLVAEVGPHQVVAGAGRVALVEDEVDHGQHRVETIVELVGGRHPEGDAGLADLSLGPDQPLGHGRFGYEEGASDLRRGQTGDRAQGERHPCLRSERGMAAGHQQRQLIVRRGRRLGRPSLHPGQRLLSIGPTGLAAKPVDGSAAGDGGQPRAGPVRNPGAGPRAEGLGDRVLGRVLGRVEVAEITGERGDEQRPLVAHDRADGVVDGVPHERRRGAQGKSRIGRTSTLP